MGENKTADPTYAEGKRMSPAEKHAFNLVQFNLQNLTDEVTRLRARIEELEKQLKEKNSGN